MKIHIFFSKSGVIKNGNSLYYHGKLDEERVMAANLLTELRNLTFSRLETPEIPQDQNKVSLNIIKVSIWGFLSSGSVATISFVFSRYLVHNESSRAAASHIFKAVITSCAIYAAIVSYTVIKIITTKYRNQQDLNFFQSLNKQILVVATCSSHFGLVGAVLANLASNYVKSNAPVSFFTKHAFYPLIGVSIAGSTLMYFLRWQQKQFLRRL